MLCSTTGKGSKNQRHNPYIFDSHFPMDPDDTGRVGWRGGRGRGGGVKTEMDESIPS